MNRRAEACRNFQRGSCQYGDRCKFLHVTQQQSKPNPFGFGNQSSSHILNTTQQQKPNPFGFGVPNNSQSKGAASSNPAKAFDNKWIRPTNSTPSQQTDSQPHAVNHKCTDPESCKRQIVEDFKNEAPLWKLTCYGHFKYLPCDITGDISFEELRAAAYDDARRGLNLQTIVEREKALLSSKLSEFDKLLHNPYTSRNPIIVGANQFASTTNNSLLSGAQSITPPSFSSFSQLKAFGPDTRGHTFGASPSSSFGPPNLLVNNNQASADFRMNFGVPATGGATQPQTQPSRSSPGPIISSFKSGTTSNGSEAFSFLSAPQKFPGSMNQSFSFPEPKDAPNTLYEASMREKEEDNSDCSIWLKGEWSIGEIPEEEPPRRFC